MKRITEFIYKYGNSCECWITLHQHMHTNDICTTHVNKQWLSCTFIRTISDVMKNTLEQVNS